MALLLADPGQALQRGGMRGRLSGLGQALQVTMSRPGMARLVRLDVLLARQCG